MTKSEIELSQAGFGAAVARTAGRGVRAAATAALVAAAIALAPGAAIAQDSGKGDTVRPELGKTLTAAQSLIQANKMREALGKLKEADAVANRTPYENYVLERLRATAASRAGDNLAAIKAFEAVLATGRLGPKEKAQFRESLIASHYRARDYNSAVSAAEAYFRDGGADAQVRTLYIQSLYLKNDFAGVVREVGGDVAADEKAGRAAPEDRLQLLGNAYLKQSNNAGYMATLERLLASYPKKEYWTDAIYRVAQTPGTRDRLALDLSRLRMAVGQSRTVADYLDPAQLALQAGFPVEAMKFLEKGFAAGVLGKGPEGERHVRLRELAKKNLAEDTKALAAGESQAGAGGDAQTMLGNGFNLVLHGKGDKGLALMSAGIAKKGLKRPNDAQLLLGYAQHLAGNRAKAVQTMRAVGGTDGASALARLWAIHLGSAR